MCMEPCITRYLVNVNGEMVLSKTPHIHTLLVIAFNSTNIYFEYNDSNFMHGPVALYFDNINRQVISEAVIFSVRRTAFKDFDGYIVPMIYKNRKLTLTVTMFELLQ
jgi:hypothetical protein